MMPPALSKSTLGTPKTCSESSTCMNSARTSITRPLPPIVLMLSACTWNDSMTEDSGKM